MSSGGGVAVALIGTSLAVALGSAYLGRRKPMGTGEYKANRGFTTKNCVLVVTNLEKARATAYATGRQGPTYDEAKVRLFGGCGGGSKLFKLGSPAALRNLYFLAWELLRGALDAELVSREFADGMVEEALLTFKAEGIDPQGLPVEFP